MAISQPILTTDITLDTELAQRLWRRAYHVVTRSVNTIVSMGDPEKRGLLRGIVNNRLGVFKGRVTRAGTLVETYVSGLSEEEMERFSASSLRYSAPITLSVDVSGLPQTRFLETLGVVDGIVKNADKLLLLGFMEPDHHRELLTGLYREGNRFGLFCGRVARQGELFLAGKTKAPSRNHARTDSAA